MLFYGLVLNVFVSRLLLCMLQEPGAPLDRKAFVVEAGRNA